MQQLSIQRCLLASTLSLACGAAQATEGAGLGVYPDGLENFMSGALPPPGMYGIVYTGSMRYDSVRDAAGRRLDIPDFRVRVNMVAPRLIWVTKQTLLGGQLAWHMVAPLLDVDVRAGGMRHDSRGLGDITVGPALGYHVTPALHYLVALEVIAPTGRYAREDPSSLGKNVWALQPVLALSYVKPHGWNLDLKAMADFNRKNGDTDTRSGRAVHADYAIGWGFGNGWVVGVGGHGYRQVSDDTGPAAAGRARAFAIGPALKYDSGKGWLMTAKYQSESGVRNRPQGEQFHVKLVLPL